MFTGLIENIGTVTSLRKKGGGILLTLKPASAMEVQLGESVSVNGVCLTVVGNAKETSFEVSPETLKSTNIGEIRMNEKVNLERALRLTDRLGGHIVTGHVDGVGAIIGKRLSGEYTFYTFESPQDILRYTVIKGSIAVDGISLTVIGLNHKSFSVAVIPHTLTATNIGDKDIGDRVNLEADIIGKYIEKFVRGKDMDAGLMDLLKEKGYTE